MIQVFVQQMNREAGRMSKQLKSKWVENLEQAQKLAGHWFPDGIPKPSDVRDVDRVYYGKPSKAVRTVYDQGEIRVIFEDYDPPEESPSLETVQKTMLEVLQDLNRYIPEPLVPLASDVPDEDLAPFQAVRAKLYVMPQAGEDVALYFVRILKDYAAFVYDQLDGVDPFWTDGLRIIPTSNPVTEEFRMKVWTRWTTRTEWNDTRQETSSTSRNGTEPDRVDTEGKNESASVSTAEQKKTGRKKSTKKTTSKKTRPKTKKGGTI